MSDYWLSSLSSQLTTRYIIAWITTLVAMKTISFIPFIISHLTLLFQCLHMVFFIFKNWNNNFMAWKLMRRWPCLKSQKNCDKLQKLHFPIFNNSYDICHYISSLNGKKKIILCCDFIDMQHCPILYLGPTYLHLCFSKCFWRLPNLGTKSFLSPFNLCANMTPNHIHFTIRANHSFHP